MEDRPDPRPDLRPQLRPTDSRAAAQARAAEILGHLNGELNDQPDNFSIDPGIIPDGWSYEWKRHTVLGAENPAYEVGLARTGWTPVPVDRHPQYMPKGYGGKAIERDGLILMERPAVITEQVKATELRKARAQVRAKEEQLGQTPQGQFEREHQGQSLVKAKRSFEAPIPIPE